jgi:DNA-directed RNA polymerase subunit M/transcription elongation factor TFIIS
MNFCPNCGTLLKIVPHKIVPSQAACPKCKYAKSINQNEDEKQNIRLKRQLEIAVIDRRDESVLRPFPMVTAICPACGKNKCETWSIAVGGETANSTLTFFRCIACGNTRREAG